MKAKEIISLYENKLSTEEIYSFVVFYFKKKLKSIGAHIFTTSTNGKYDDLVIASFDYKNINNLKEFVPKELYKNYALSFVKIVGKSCVPVWGDEDVYIPIFCGKFHLPLFIVEVTIRTDTSYRIVIKISTEFLEYCNRGIINSFREFSTEQAIKQNVYPLIDSIIKAIRLVSLV